MSNDNKPRLLVTASTFPRSISDTEPRFVFDLCKELKKDFAITILAPSAPDSLLEETVDGIKIIRYRYAPFRKMETLAYPGSILARIKAKPVRVFLVPLLLFGLYRAVKKQLKQEHYDIVHAHWLFPQGVIQSFIKNKKFPPYIITGHGGDITSLNRFPLKQLKQRAINYSSGMTVVARHQLDFMKKNYIDGKGNERFAHIPMGCNTKKFDS